MFSLLELNSITWTNGETLRMNDKALYDSSHSPRREAKEANNANPLSPNTIWCLEITSGSFIYGTKREGKKNHLKGDWWVLQRDWGGGISPHFSYNASQLSNKASQLSNNASQLSNKAFKFS